MRVPGNVQDVRQLSDAVEFVEPTGRGFEYEYDAATDITEVFVAPSPTMLMPGDADRDLDFDALDLIQVQRSAKYLTGILATWGEGDWNGGPGGTTRHPPTGDGLFDQLDLVAALTADIYLTGPYSARTNAWLVSRHLGNDVVPEPEGIALLIAGLACSAVFRLRRYSFCRRGV